MSIYFSAMNDVAKFGSGGGNNFDFRLALIAILLMVMVGVTYLIQG